MHCSFWKIVGFERKLGKKEEEELLAELSAAVVNLLATGEIYGVEREHQIFNSLLLNTAASILLAPFISRLVFEAD
ncbi:hypothetical protein T4B_9317 [Trichinella pseudospiralis]|uniref:Uncharacterized protein n=1 Tax=Trichinella pseudospiralis TaxID=6337 RepID=A0A0V1IBX9_TRIPS|nr:hypothetical protein T4B_9317 [Trichinella pseudospiralis]